MQRTVLVFIGPQGSGKGTQATILADSAGFHVIEMGALLRLEGEKQTQLSQEIKKIMTHGDFVPVEITMQLVRNALAHLPADVNIIFDGFPRTVEQALELDKLIRITKVVHIDVPPDVSVKRISGRLVCPHGHNYNTFYVPPRVPGICNVDHMPLTHRADDTTEAVKHRLALYTELTSKVLDYYRTQGKLITVNGDGTIFAVSHQIKTEVLATV